MNIKPLNWDSDFFNMKVGLLEKCPKRQLENIELDAYKLIYQITKNPCNVDLDNFFTSYSEIKLLFKKDNLKFNKVQFKNIHHIQDVAISYDELYEIAFESGKYSRFNQDPNFSEDQFKSLYRKWIDTSLENNEHGILVSILDRKLTGFISYSHKRLFTKVGLFAVHPNFQGKGIGTMLLQSVENIVLNVENKYLIIPTQKNNIQACDFYNKNGYSVSETINIKHHWNK